MLTVKSYDCKMVLYAAISMYTIAVQQPANLSQQIIPINFRNNLSSWKAQYYFSFLDVLTSFLLEL